MKLFLAKNDSVTIKILAKTKEEVLERLNNDPLYRGNGEFAEDKVEIIYNNISNTACVVDFRYNQQ